jgi:hypothetical protein
LLLARIAVVDRAEAELTVPVALLFPRDDIGEVHAAEYPEGERLECAAWVVS